jgi:hypothetical protein
MLKATLYFPSFEVLCQFRRKLTARNITLFSKINVLVAELEEVEIQLACKQYYATVIRKQGTGRIVAIHPANQKEAI